MLLKITYIDLPNIECNNNYIWKIGIRIILKIKTIDNKMSTPLLNISQPQDLEKVMQKLGDRRVPDRGLSPYAVFLRIYGNEVLTELRSEMNPGQSGTSRLQNRPGLKLYSQKMKELWDRVPSDQKIVFTQASIKTGYVEHRPSGLSNASRRLNRLNRQNK